MASQGPSENKGNTLLFLLHAKRVILKPWVAEYLKEEPLKLKWEMQYDGFEPEQNLLLESESEPFQLEKLEAENVDTVCLVTQTMNLDDKLVLNDKISLKLELVIGNSPHVLVGTAIYKLNTLKIRSQISPFSFELKNENDTFVGYVDVFYVSQQRWVKMHKNSLPMMGKRNTESKDDDTTMSSDYFTDESPYSAINDSPYSANDSSEDDYVMIFWNSANTCFVRNHPNDVQLQELYTFVSSSLKNGHLNATIELNVRKDGIGGQKEKLDSTLLKPLTYTDAKTLMHISQSTPEVSSSNQNSQQSGDSSSKSALSFTIDDIQHSSRLYSSSLPSVERFLEKPVFNDPTSFYNYISRQNKHFQSILSKKFLSPSSRVEVSSTGKSAISEKSPPRFGSKLIKHTQSTIDTMSSFNKNLSGYSGPSIDTVTTDLVSLENKSSCNAIDDITIGDATITTTKTTFSNTTFNDKDQNSARLVSLTEHKLFNIHENNIAPMESQNDTLDPQMLKGDYVSSIRDNYVPSMDEHYVTPICEKSVTVYSIFSPVSSIDESYSQDALYDAMSSHGSASVFDEPIELPLDNLRSIDTLPSSLYYKSSFVSADSARKNVESIRNYFKQPQNAYYVSDQDIDYSQDMDYLHSRNDYGYLLCEHSILDLQMMVKDLFTLSNSNKPSAIGVRCSQETINNALEDAKLLKAQCEILPKAAIIKIFLKYLTFYASEMVPIASHLETITQKQLKTIKRISNNIDDVISYIDNALILLIRELRDMATNVVSIETLPFEFMKRSHESGKEPQGMHTSETYNFFIYDTQTTETEVDDFEIDRPVTDKNVALQNVITTMYHEVGSIGSRRLVYVSKMHTIQTKSRGCLIRLATIKLAFYRTFCGRRKIAIGFGQVLKV